MEINWINLCWLESNKDFDVLETQIEDFVRFRSHDPGAHVSLNTYLVVYYRIQLAIVPRGAYNVKNYTG